MADRYSPIDIIYQDETYFTNTDGSIYLKSYEGNILLYSSFDTNVNANYALANTTATTTGSPTITAGGVFGNYVDLTNSSIKYNSCNFDNYYEDGTFKFRMRLDFDNGATYQEFLTSSTTGNTILRTAQNPNDIIFYAGFDSSINATWANGVTAATGYGGISYGAGGKFSNLLLLNSNDTRYLTYASLNNTPANTGCFNFWYKPNYSGSPATNQVIFTIKDTSTNKNKITLTHKTDGNFNVTMYDSSAVLVQDYDFGIFTPVSGTLYNIELNYNLTSGSTLLFVNGTQLGSTSTATGTRDTTHTILQIGSDSIRNNFSIDEFLVYSAPQHSSSFTPSNVETQQTMPEDTVYEFKLKVNGIYIGGSDISITITSTDTFADIATSIHDAINALALGSASCAVNATTGKIRITAGSIGWAVSIEAPASGNNLLTVLGGVDISYIPNGPTSDTIFAQFYNGSNNNNRIYLQHTTLGQIRLVMYNSSGTSVINEILGVWSSVSNTWYEFALCFNGQIAQLFIDGSAFGDCVETNYTRTLETDFYLAGHATDGYGFDELVIYNYYKYIENYTPATSAQTQYPTNNPYVILNYGTGISSIESITSSSSGSLSVVVYIGTSAYYWSGAAWITSDGSYSQSNPIATFLSRYSTITLDSTKMFKLKIFFHSDGLTAAYLTNLYVMIPTATPTDYSTIITWIRTKLGEPVIPVELDDSQIEANIEEALQRWMYYRNTKDDYVKVDLTGNATDGYTIPTGWEDFHDIVFTPNSPVSGLVYSGDWGKNIYLQYYYSLVSGGGGFMSGLLTDFYLTLSAMSDAGIILGFQPTYKVYNGKLFIHPDPMAAFSIGLIKRRTPSVTEINSDMWLRRYVLALCKITLGEMRELISQIPAGMENVPLNGPALKAEGLAERTLLDNEFRLRMEPLFLDFF